MRDVFSQIISSWENIWINFTVVYVVFIAAMINDVFISFPAVQIYRWSFIYLLATSNNASTRFSPGSPVIIQGKTNYSSSLRDSVSMNCSVYNSFNITWYHDNHRITQGKTYTILESVESNKNVSVLTVNNLNCQMAGNYTCVAANEYGSDQRQFTLKILGEYCKSKRGNVSLWEMCWVAFYFL